MHFSTVLAAVALFVTVEASSIPLTRAPRLAYQFSNGTANLEAFSLELRSLKAKYERNARNARQRKQSNSTSQLRERGSLSLAYPESYIWTGPVQVGTPAQTYTTYFDTGSADFTMADVSCTNAKCGSKKRYDVSASSTGVKTTTVSRTNFVDGSSSVGTLMKDTVVVGGVTAPNQAIISSTSLSTTVLDIPSDALMGLAWTALASNFQPSVPVNQAANGGGKTFSMTLSKTPGKSSIVFGATTTRTAPGNRPTFYNVAYDSGSSFPTYWQIAASAPYVNGAVAVSGSQNFILDSGTTLIIAPLSAATAFWSKIPGSAKYDANMWSFPCNSAPLVQMRFTRLKTLWTVRSTDFNLGYIPGNPTQCLGAVATLNVGLGSSWILGDSFLLSVNVIHDIGNAKIGISAQK